MGDRLKAGRVLVELLASGALNDGLELGHLLKEDIGGDAGAAAELVALEVAGVDHRIFGLIVVNAEVRFVKGLGFGQLALLLLGFLVLDPHL